MKTSGIAGCEINDIAPATKLPFCEWYILSNTHLAGDTRRLLYSWMEL